MKDLKIKKLLYLLLTLLSLWFYFSALIGVHLWSKSYIMKL